MEGARGTMRRRRKRGNIDKILGRLEEPPKKRLLDSGCTRAMPV